MNASLKPTLIAAQETQAYKLEPPACPTLQHCMQIACSNLLLLRLVPDKTHVFDLGTDLVQNKLPQTECIQ